MSGEPMKVWRCPDHGPSVDPYRCFCAKSEEVEVIPVEQAERLEQALRAAANELQRAGEMLYKADWNYGESGAEMEEAASAALEAAEKETGQ